MTLFRLPSSTRLLAIAKPIVLAGVVACVSTAVAGDSTEWIWGKRGTGRFEHSQNFDLSSPPHRARLKCAADFCAATLWLNDNVVCRFHSGDSFQIIDVSRWLKQGDNRLRISAESDSGPAALAYELQIEMKGEQTLVVRSSNGEHPQNRSTHHAYGDVGDEPWWNITMSPKVSVFDEYNQWKEAVSGSADKELASFQVADGFQFELLYSAQPNQGSWVSMELDDKGRILLGREDVGILRLTLPKDRSGMATVETLNDSLQGVHGLLLTDRGLIANANRSEALYLLTATNENPFGKVIRLQETIGGRGDHGRHDVVQDAKQRIYVIHGDSVQIPDRFTSLVPATNEFVNGKPEDGHVIQTDIKGSQWNVFCSGLRNPYGLARNHAGELFTYDADAERHTGLPWYRPTRIVHLMPGVDYGWRNPENPWPGYLPDMMPAIEKIGRGSPTSLKFAYRADFPPAYKNALFALDWSYGRILAVHLVPKGSTYSAHAEVFARGRPFSVCDLDFGADGSMYVVTGGRDTQSRLYRIRYVGKQPRFQSESQQAADRSKYSKDMRQQRGQLEAIYDQPGDEALELAWDSLPHADPGIRSAARILLEHQPVPEWQERLFEEQDPATALPALLALVRVGPKEQFPEIHKKLQSLPSPRTCDLPIVVRIESLIDKSLNREQQRSKAICASLESHFPTGERTIDRELCRLLVDHDSKVVVARTLDILADETNQIDHFHYLVCLADASQGWNSDRHHEYFRLLSGAKLFITDEGLNDRLQQLFDKALVHVAGAERPEYRQLFASDDTGSDVHTEALPFLTKWTVAEIMDRLNDLGHSPDIQSGARVFRSASCNRLPSIR